MNKMYIIIQVRGKNRFLKIEVLYKEIKIPRSS